MIVYLRIPDEERADKPKPAGSDVRVVAAQAEKIKQEHKKEFTKALSKLEPDSAATSLKPMAEREAAEAVAADEKEADEASKPAEPPAAPQKPAEPEKPAEPAAGSPKKLGTERKLSSSLGKIGEDEAVTDNPDANSIGDAWNKFGAWVGDRVRSLSGQSDKDEPPAVSKPANGSGEYPNNSLGRQFSGAI